MQQIYPSCGYGTTAAPRPVTPEVPRGSSPAAVPEGGAIHTKNIRLKNAKNAGEFYSAGSEKPAKIVKNAREFFRWGLSDNRPVMLAPFHWNGGQRKPNGSVVGGAGIIDLPRCAATYRAIGEIVIAAGSEGTTLDPVHRPPTPAPDGSFPEPECGNPIQPAPAAWSWCRREN